MILLAAILFAVELSASQVLRVDTGDPSAFQTIQAAIDAASPGDTIEIAGGGYAENLVIGKDLVILGGGAYVNGGGTGRVILVQPACNVRIEYLSIVNGYTSQDPGGAGILNYGSLQLSHCSVESNQLLDGNGSGICNLGTMEIVSGQISNNTILNNGNGSGICNLGTMEIVSCQISENTIETGSGYGAGIANSGQMTIDRSWVWDNFLFRGSGAGIKNLGTVDISSSTVQGNIIEGGSGAGIASDGPMTIDQSDISYNSTTYGGGIAAGDQTLIKNSAIHHNSAASGDGGGIIGGSMTLINCTISGNTTYNGNGGGLAGSNILLKNCTVTANSAIIPMGGFAKGGGLFTAGYGNQPGVMTLFNTILAQNVGEALSDGYPTGQDCYGPLESLGFNLIGNTNGCLITPAPGDQIGSSTSPIDPMLGPLQNNGGPTPTHALLPWSPVIDAGDNTAAPPTDQRGFARIFGATIDIGAYELYVSDCLLTCPSDISVGNDPGTCGAVVNYAPPVTSGTCSGLVIACNPPSGSTFPVGTTVVTCIATDANNVVITNCSFNVTVIGGPEPPPDGTVLAWGDGYYGQLGDGNFYTDPPATPVQVSGFTGALAIACGYSHSLALKSDGTVWAWGWGEYGQLGDGNFYTTGNHGVATPVQVSGFTGAAAIAGGSAHSLALKSDGTVWAWGYGEAGQLGDGNFYTTGNHGVATPVQVSGLTGAVAIAGGGDHSLAIKSDGTVWAWGYGYSGQLGDGNFYTDPPYGVATPVQVSGLSSVVAIAGGSGSLALKSDGTVWAWGWDYGVATPVQVMYLSGVVAIAAEGRDAPSLALKSDGTVWAWWSYEVNVNAPVPVSGLSNVRAIAGGRAHSLALKFDGTVWALGFGLTLPVSGLSQPVSAIAAGWQHSLALPALSATTPLVITCPIDIAVNNDPGQSSAVVNYPAPLVSGGAGNVLVVCNPPAGSVFPAGTTTVTCIATDSACNSASCSFKVTVNATPSCTLTCPQDITVPSDPGNCGAVVNYPPPTTSGDCSGLTSTSTPPSGSTFPVGTNSVTFTSTDATGNMVANCTFRVVVNDTEPSVASYAVVKAPALFANPLRIVGWFQLLATDNCDPDPLIYLKGNAGSFVAGPFHNGDQVELSRGLVLIPRQAPSTFGGNIATVQLNGDVLLWAVDSSDNASTPIKCK